MTPAALSALIDAHDALVKACIDGELSLSEFAAAYGGFPATYALAAPSVLGRVAFHRRVAALLEGLWKAKVGWRPSSPGACNCWRRNIHALR